jgi:hypothetical protein
VAEAPNKRVDRATAALSVQAAKPCSKLAQNFVCESRRIRSFVAERVGKGARSQTSSHTSCRSLIGTGTTKAADDFDGRGGHSDLDAHHDQKIQFAVAGLQQQCFGEEIAPNNVFNASFTVPQNILRSS